MRVGVDAVAFTGAGAGIVRYLRETLSWMVRDDPSIDFYLYAPVPIDPGLPAGNWRVRVPCRRNHLRRGQWLRADLPDLLADDRVDVYWGQNQMMPHRLVHTCHRVLTVHDLTGLLFPSTMQLTHRLSWRVNFRAAVRAADHIVAVSMATARLLEVCLGAGSRVSTVYPGCAAALKPVSGASARNPVLQRLGLPRDYMLTVGTIEPRKNHLTLLHALTMLKTDLPLVVVGGLGWRCASIVGEIHRQQALGRVLYVGRVSDEDLRVLYSAARLMIYPSIYEGFGSPVLEAMACGCPVVCSWSSSLPEVGGSAASYFRPRDADHLARRLHELLGNEQCLAAMRADGINRAAKFSYQRTAYQLLDVFRRVARVC